MRAVLLIALLLTPSAIAARQSPPLPDADAFLAAVRENLARTQQEQDRYAYKERRTELHTNPFGRLGTGAWLLYDVRPVGDGSSVIRRLIARDGQPVTDAPEERQRLRSRDPQRPRRSFDDVLAALRFAIDRRDVVDGRPTIVVTFTPRADARPKTRQGKMARVFAGSVWVDEQTHEVERVEATAVDDLSVGFGVVARLNKGTRVTLTRKPLANGLWLPTSIKFAGEGRAMLFRKLTLDYAIEWLDYQLVGSR